MLTRFTHELTLAGNASLSPRRTVYGLRALCEVPAQGAVVIASTDPLTDIGRQQRWSNGRCGQVDPVANLAIFRSGASPRDRGLRTGMADTFAAPVDPLLAVCAVLP
jgi:hypothetical protein